MSKSALLKAVAAAGGFLFLCAAPELALGQSSQPGAAPPAPTKSAVVPHRGSPPDLLAGLTLTDDQKAKIDQVREDTKSRLAAVANDKKLSPEAADAMFQGLQRVENSKIYEVLTPEQRVAVRKRMAAWRAASGKPQYPLRRLPSSQQAPQPQ